MATPRHDASRRRLFGALAGREPVRRPPWTGEDFLERCTGCDACLEACPEGVLHRGAGGYPEIRFERDGCSLCGRCADACAEGVFDRSRTAFPWRAEIQDTCLALADIHCQSCQDACEWQAIRFTPRRGGPPRPHLDPQACTGCGACEPVCPARAITLAAPQPAEPHGELP